MKKIKAKTKTVLAVLSALAFLLFSISSSIFAGDARLYLSPSSGSYYVGSNFSVAVLVGSGSHQTNAYKAVIKFPPSLLAVSAVSFSGSICTLQITGSPNYSNSSGTVNLECGHTGSFSGSSGTIGTITFSVKSAGTAALSFTTAQIKAADGSGTEVLGSTSGANFTLKPVPLAAPAVSSPTHPDQNSWYAQNQAVFSWLRPSGSVDFSYILDRGSQTIPDNIPETTGLTASYNNLTDGVYYFHIKARDASGWGQTAHFRIRIDTAPPEPFKITSVPDAENVTIAPLIKGKARDTTSGISHYELSLDGGFFQSVAIPYQFSRIAEGTHVVTVRAYDRAGNYREANLTLQVIDIAEPVITNPANGAFIPILERLEIKGLAPQGLVELYLNNEFLALVESDGEFSYLYQEFLKPGSYTLKAKAVTEGGVESSPVESRFTVDPRAVSLLGLTLPGWLVYSLLLGTIIGLLALLILFFKRRRERERHFVEDIEKIEREVNQKLGAAEKESDRAVEEILAGGRKGRVLRLERKIEKIEGETRSSLIEDLEKIKRHHRVKTQEFRFPRKVIVTGILGDILKKVQEELKKRKKAR